MAQLYVQIAKFLGQLKLFSGNLLVFLSSWCTFFSIS